MKRALLILTLLLWARQSFASYTHRATADFSCENASFAANATSLTCPASQNPNTTDLITCYFFWSNGIDSSSPASISMADLNGNSYTKTPSSPYNGTNYKYYLKNAPANASGNIIATFSSNGSSGGFVVILCEVFTDSTPSTTTLDIESGGTDGGSPSTAITTPTISATGSGELLVAWCAPDNSITTANSPWTIGVFSGGTGFAAEFQVSAGSTAVNFTQNASGGWTCVGMSFATSGGGGGGGGAGGHTGLLLGLFK